MLRRAFVTDGACSKNFFICCEHLQPVCELQRPKDNARRRVTVCDR
jgi:hypothetical protein